MILGCLDRVYHVCDAILDLYHEDPERADQVLEKYGELDCGVDAWICGFVGFGVSVSLLSQFEEKQT